MYVIKGGGWRGKERGGNKRSIPNLPPYQTVSSCLCVHCLQKLLSIFFSFSFFFFSFSMFYDYATLPRARAFAASEVEDDETETAGAEEARAAVRFFPSSRFVQSDVKMRKNSVFI